MNAFAQRGQRPGDTASASRDGGGHTARPPEHTSPREASQQALSERLNQAPKVQSLVQLKQALNRGPRQSPPPVQRQAARGGGAGTGLPEHLQAGLESLSSTDLSQVNVHYNSSKPAQLGALAYTQGSEIHLGPGQEKHLPHEGWHAVQQLQGRVSPTVQAKGVALNDAPVLEREADVMGGRAARAGRGGGLPRALSPRGGPPAHAGGTVQRVIDFSTYEKLHMELQQAPGKAEGLAVAVSLGRATALESLQQLRLLIKRVKAIPDEAIGNSTFLSVLSTLAEKVAKELEPYEEDLRSRGDLLESPKLKGEWSERLLTYENLPESTKKQLSEPGGLDALKTPLPEVEEWALLNEDLQGDPEYGSRFQILDALAGVLRPFRQRIKALIPQARLKFRGSLVRGLKGYPKGGVKVNTEAYDCDAFIEVPSEFWLDMRKRGAQGIERDPLSGIETDKVEIRGYEPLDAISFKSEERASKGEHNYPAIIQGLRDIQKEAQAAIQQAQESGALKGYKYESNEIDFEFYIRPVYNSATTYLEGNPYLIGQVAARGYPVLEESLGVSTVKEFDKKKERPESQDMLGPYVKEHGPVGVVMPEYQAVIGKHSWYLETSELHQWRIMKRQLDTERKAKTQYSRSALSYYKAPFPAYEKPYAETEDRGPLVAESRDPMYDLITQPDIVRMDQAVFQLNTTMSSIKLFDKKTNILSLKDPEKIPVIAKNREALLGQLQTLENKYPELTQSPFWATWVEGLARVAKKLEEAIELRDTHNGSKKIVRDHSLERGYQERKKKKEEQVSVTDSSVDK